MQQQKDFLIRVVYGAVWLAVIYLAARYVLLWLLPFLIALGLAALAEPAIDFCRRKMRFKRAFTAAVLTLALLAGLSTLVWLLLEQLLAQAVDLLTNLPDRLTALPLLLDLHRVSAELSLPSLQHRVQLKRGKPAALSVALSAPLGAIAPPWLQNEMHFAVKSGDFAALRRIIYEKL